MESTVPVPFGGIVFLIFSFVGIIVWIIPIVAMWRAMKAHESIARYSKLQRTRDKIKDQ